MTHYVMFGNKVIFNYINNRMKIAIEGGTEEYNTIKSSFNNDMTPVELYHYLVRFRVS